MNPVGERWHVALLLGVVLTVYISSLNGSFHYDDFHSIVQNPHIRELGKIGDFFVDRQMFSADADKGMYRPLLLVSYALNYAIGGYDVVGYHLVNLAIHLIVALLVYGIGRRVGCGANGSLIAALLFGLHPLCSEPVNYISSRSESLAACFFLGAFYLYVDGKKRSYPGALICFACGLLVKSVVITLPAVLLAYDVWRKRKGVEWRRHIPFWGTSAAYVGVLLVTGFLGDARGRSPRGIGEQLWTQTKGMVYYLKLVGVPIDLNVEHQFRASADPWNSTVLTAGAFCVSLVLIIGSILDRKRGFWFIWIGLTLLPTTLIPLNVLVNEHRLYLPLVGLALFAGESLGGRVKIGSPLAIVLLAVWGILVFQRNSAWESEMTLWRDAVEKSPGMARAHVHYGNALRERGDWRRALEEFESAVRIEPENRAARTNLGNLYYELAERDPERGTEHLQRAVRAYEQVLAGDPEYREALNNLAGAYWKLGRLDEAEGIYRQVVEKNPNFPDGYFNLGLLAAQREQFGLAITHYRRALELREDGEVYFEMGNCYTRQGDLDKAGEAYRRAVTLDPGEARYAYNLAEVLLVRGEREIQAGNAEQGTALWGEARGNLERVLRLEPGHARASERLNQLRARMR